MCACSGEGEEGGARHARQYTKHTFNAVRGNRSTGIIGAENFFELRTALNLKFHGIVNSSRIDDCYGVWEGRWNELTRCTR